MCFSQETLQEKYNKTVEDGLSRVRNVTFDDISSVQLTLSAELGGLGVSSATLLALPVFLPSASSAREFLKTVLLGPFEDFYFTEALEKCFVVTNEPDVTIDVTQRNSTQSVLLRTAQTFISETHIKQ